MLICPLQKIVSYMHAYPFACARASVGLPCGLYEGFHSLDYDVGWEHMKRKVASVLISAGIAMFVLGLILTFFWMEGSPGPRDYVVQAGGKLELSWYLQPGDRTEGSFTASGGSEETRFSIKNPFGAIIYSVEVKGRYDTGFTAQDSGVYSFIFENLDQTNDESIFVSFRSPYEPRLTVYDEVGLLTLLGSIVILFSSIRSLVRAS
jgi:hypothetical protein